MFFFFFLSAMVDSITICSTRSMCVQHFHPLRNFETMAAGDTRNRELVCYPLPSMETCCSNRNDRKKYNTKSEIIWNIWNAICGEGNHRLIRLERRTKTAREHRPPRILLIRRTDCNVEKCVQSMHWPNNKWRKNMVRIFHQVWTDTCRPNSYRNCIYFNFRTLSLRIDIITCYGFGMCAHIIIHLEYFFFSCRSSLDSEICACNMTLDTLNILHGLHSVVLLNFTMWR